MFIRYSLINAIILFNLAMIVVSLLRHRTGYLARYTTAALISLLLLGSVRVFIPLSIPNLTFVIHSYELIPAIESFLRFDVMPGDSRLEIQHILLVIWGIGIIGMGFRALRKIKMFRFVQKSYQIIDNAREQQAAQELGMKKVSIIVSPNVSVPYVLGVFRAKIYLPPLNLSDEKLKMILRHEYHHFKAKDALIKLFYLLLSIVFWWNPFIHIFIRDLDCLLEIRCDAVMSKRMTRDEKETYLDTFLDIYRNNVNNVEPTTTSGLFRTGNEKLVVQRFQLLTSENKSFVRQLVSVMIVVFIFLASFLVIIQPFYHLPPEYMEEGVFYISPENSLIVLTSDGRYRLYINNLFIDELNEITAPFADIPIIDEGR